MEMSSLLTHTQVLSKVITISLRGARNNLVSTFTEDRKGITLTSSEEDGMISQDLCNLVFYILEE